ncbi:MULTISPECIES: CPXCG motif-containing cysteine-rich protein [Dyella]|uniref:CPXCG motif-containing cysteine-rich protein n=2 Tax=Dyella TaxID=231454 RepID=A0A4R0YX36_9GAMM|nr:MULTISPECIES: CPXCG motif-containing cysteine-rich protein [Dyella]TBR40510.1 CPXCG motif-containing cysteine-rich protein [Dyella terrae]TCI11909.1 CPXCG motif-containing cysteine-rich protein [Dyella soli]
MNDTVAVSCPYCGERIDLIVDVSAGEQEYIEDCQVCCRPMVVTAWVDEKGDARALVNAEDDS